MDLDRLRRNDLKGSGKIIGSLQWHPDRPKHVVFNADSPLVDIPLRVLEAIVAKSKEVLIK